MNYIGDEGRKYNNEVKQTACQILSAGRYLLHSQRLHANQLTWIDLPKELQQLIFTKIDSEQILNDKQIRNILGFAYKKETLGCTKDWFLEQTGCNRILHSD